MEQEASSNSNVVDVQEKTTNNHAQTVQNGSQSNSSSTDEKAPTTTATTATNGKNKNQKGAKQGKKQEELQTDQIDVVSDTPLDAETLKHFKAAIGKGQKATDAKFVLNQVDKKDTFHRDNLRLKSTLYFKNCKGCEYTVDSKCVKVLIEGCENTVINFQAAVTTSVVELWKCENVNIVIGSKIQTFQVDMSKQISLNYGRRDYIHSVVWAGVHHLTIAIPNGAGGKESLITGFSQMQDVYPGIKEDFDQFIVRLLEGKLVSEQVVRLENGFPTTEREAREFDEREARNKKAADKHIKKLVKSVEIKHNVTKKVGRNDPCSCGSSQKYKKCCGKN